MKEQIKNDRNKGSQICGRKKNRKKKARKKKEKQIERIRKERKRKGTTKNFKQRKIYCKVKFKQVKKNVRKKSMDK